MFYGHRVDRRWVGMMVLFVVVVGTWAIPHVTQHQVGGTATVAPPPGPPAIGDCLLQPVGGRGGAALPVHAAVTTGPCAGSRYGEVVALIPDAQVQPLQQDINGGPAVDPNLDTCASKTVSYLGLGASPGHPANPATPGHPISVFTYWSPVLLTSSFYAAGPSARQSLMGQRWLACITYVPDTQTQISMTYQRSARGTFTTGTPPTVYAVCLETADAAMLSITGCRQPHAAEIFGYTFAAAATPVPALDATCLAMIKELTGMGDPTAGGRLTAGTTAGNPAGSDTSDSRSLSCMVSAPAGHHLTGPLLNLGNKPPPLD